MEKSKFRESRFASSSFICSCGRVNASPMIASGSGDLSPFPLEIRERRCFGLAFCLAIAIIWRSRDMAGAPTNFEIWPETPSNLHLQTSTSSPTRGQLRNLAGDNLKSTFYKSQLFLPGDNFRDNTSNSDWLQRGWLSSLNRTQLQY